MAKITITIEDDEDGVDAHAYFDPNLPKEEGELTPAQQVGLAVLTFAFPPEDESVEWKAREEETNNE